MLLPFGFGVFCLAAYVTVAWRSPQQAAPTLSHDGMRWLVYQSHPVRPSQVLALLAVLAVWFVGWAVTGSVLLSLAFTVRAGAQVELLWIVAAISAVVALLATPWMARRAWTRLDADPAHLTLVYPWPWRAERWAWAELHDVIATPHGLTVRPRSGLARQVDAPQATAADLQRVAAWMRATRAAPAEPVSVPAPPPALERLRAH